MVIVQRGRLATFKLLTRTFAHDPTVRVVWDRRERDRRKTASPTPEDRRRRDRRASPPASWDRFQYLVVSTMADSQNGPTTPTDPPRVGFDR